MIFKEILFGACLIMALNATSFIKSWPNCTDTPWLTNNVSICHVKSFDPGIYALGETLYNPVNYSIYGIYIINGLPSWEEKIVLNHEFCNVEIISKGEPDREIDCYARDAWGLLQNA